MSACTGLPFDGRPPSVPDEPLAVLVFGHEVAPRTQTDDSRHGAIINIGRTCWQVAATRTLTPRWKSQPTSGLPRGRAPMYVLRVLRREAGEGRRPDASEQ
jgi:hypothetical protein